MAVTEHRLHECVTSDADRTVASCACGWHTGQRRTRRVALAALDAHIEKITTMTLPQALAVLSDHRLGLHDDWDDEHGCRWSGCAEAYWLVAEADG